MNNDFSNYCNDLKKSTILVVDDMEFNTIMIKQLLVKNGYSNVLTAKDGSEALEITRKNRPALVIIDLIMPEMDGFQYCTEIRKDPHFNSLPIIVQTAVNLSKQKSQAFSCGATDFVNKPIDAEELIARVNVHLENHALLHKLKAYQERLQQELQSAQQMQEALMPHQKLLDEISQNYKLNIFAYFKPSFELGGDFWSIKPINKDKLGFYMTDFSGHGIGSAINTFRLHTLLYENEDLLSNPSDLVNSVNAKISNLLPKSQFATMFYGVFDLKNNLIEYVPCASPSAIMINSLNNQVKLIKCHGIPIGVDKTIRYESNILDFQPGNSLILYSDALIETEDDNGELMSEDSLVNFIKYTIDKNKKSDGKFIFEEILKLFNTKFSKNQKDDFTITVYERSM